MIRGLHNEINKNNTVRSFFKILMLFILNFNVFIVYAQLPVLRPISSTSLLTVNPGLVIYNHSTRAGLNYVNGRPNGESVMASFDQHNDKIAGVVSLIGVLDDDGLGTRTTSIAGSYAYRVVLDRKNVIQIPISYAYTHMKFDSLHLGNRYGPRPFALDVSMKVKSQSGGVGLVYYNKPQYVYNRKSDTFNFYPSYNLFLAAYCANMITLRRQMGAPEESDFTLPILWSGVAGYHIDAGRFQVYPTLSYQSQGRFGRLSGSSLIGDMHVFDAVVNTVYDKFLLGVGGRLISGVTHVVYGQAGVSINSVDVLYSYGVDVLNNEPIVRHQFSTSIGWRQRKPPRYFGPIINPDF